jgi:hypothetical protein
MKEGKEREQIVSLLHHPPLRRGLSTREVKNKKKKSFEESGS